MIESCFDNHLNVQHATDYMGTYLMYLWAINVIVIIDCPSSIHSSDELSFANSQMGVAQTVKSWVTQFKCLFPFPGFRVGYPFFKC